MRRRVGLVEWLWHSVQQGERRVIRVMVLASVILVVMQLSVVRDPLQFYMSVASKVESPPLDLPSLAVNESAVWQLTLKAVPAAQIRVLQNGNVLATLNKGEQRVLVHSGQIQLDGTNVSQTITVQVIKNDQRLAEPRQTQIAVPAGTVQAFTVSP
ncbi:hypothetical protein REC12_24725 [Desulfosporosinus sp. PR]|uniref:hypothetical protein n=1 Tax=Candidatus Desulfosporosinus nitrosoreducens TaxID=3401928 RepID=UPI0027E6E877|nr:hypothetical protein [Desulfosporosinus sp. PR]MDQ7096802.1 hypothetical protein [Desulfosporosinus sp. PR]